MKYKKTINVAPKIIRLNWYIIRFQYSVWIHKTSSFGYYALRLKYQFYFKLLLHNRVLSGTRSNLNYFLHRNTNLLRTPLIFASKTVSKNLVKKGLNVLCYQSVTARVITFLRSNANFRQVTLYLRNRDCSYLVKMYFKLFFFSLGKGIFHI